jgi:hypothetical protein
MKKPTAFAGFGQPSNRSPPRTVDSHADSA